MHRPTLSPTQAIAFAEYLAKCTIDWSTHRQYCAMTAIGAQHGVAIGQRSASPDYDCFLTLAKMSRASHHSRGEQTLGCVLESSYLPHPLKKEQPERGRKPFLRLTAHSGHSPVSSAETNLVAAVNAPDANRVAHG
jgi:hypothetical protein